MRHRLSPEAEADLDEIWLHIAIESGSLETADKLINALTHRFWLLSISPHMGRRRDDLHAGLRSFPVGDYVILYRQNKKVVLILRIIHGSRDLPALFRPH